MFIVDHLLDILTGNEHRKTSRYVEEQKNLRKEDELLDAAFKDIQTASDPPEQASSSSSQDAAASAATTAALVKTAAAAAMGTPVKVEWDSLRSLADDGIDMSFLDSMKAEYDKQFDPAEQLKETAQLIADLKTEQDKRFATYSTVPSKAFILSLLTWTIFTD